MREETLIRLASAADASLVRELRLEALQVCPAAFTADYETNAAYPLEEWERRCDPTADHAVFIAVHDGSAVGMCGIRRGEVAKTRHAATVWGVFVRPAERGRRTGERLVAAAVSWAREHDLSVVKLAVATWNEAAIRAYERVGFAKYGIEPRAIRYDGVDHDEYLMAILF